MTALKWTQEKSDELDRLVKSSQRHADAAERSARYAIAGTLVAFVAALVNFVGGMMGWW